MKICELRFSFNSTTKKYMFGDLKKQWDFMEIAPITIGKIGGYNLFLKREKNNELIQVLDTINDKDAGYISFIIKGKAHSISETAFDNLYLGLGLATTVYAFLILKKNYILWSEDAQTKGGKSIWDKLAKVNGITVFAWDKKNKEAISLDKNDLNSDVEIYDIDVEWDKSKYAKLWKEFNTYFYTIAKLKKMKKLSPNILELQKKMMAVYRKMQNIRKEELNIENNMTLVAQKRIR